MSNHALLGDGQQMYIHIGFPKTGTTALNTNFYSQHPELIHIGKPLTQSNKTMQEFIHIITDRETLEYQMNLDDFVTQFSAGLFSSSGKYVIANESFSTGSSLPGRVDRFVIANRLKDLFPKAKIIITIRNQLSIIKSAYLQKLKFEIDPRISFLKWLDEEESRSHLTNIFHMFDFSAICGLYSQLYGRENVQVMLYEDFKQNHSGFILDLCNFMGINPFKSYENTYLNVRKSKEDLVKEKIEKFLPILRRLKILLPQSFKMLGKNLVHHYGFEDRLRLKYPEGWRSHLGDFYRPRNHNLGEKFSLKLEEHGYPC